MVFHRQILSLYALGMCFASWSSRRHTSEVHKYCKTQPPCTLAAGGLSQSRPRWFWHKAACLLFKTMTWSWQLTKTLRSHCCSGPMFHPASPLPLPLLPCWPMTQLTLQLLPNFLLLDLSLPPEYSNMSAFLPTLHCLWFPGIWLSLST